jgi:rod shape determining protein RodA
MVNVKRILKSVDWLLLGLLAALLIFNLIILKSAGYGVVSDPYYFVKRQTVWIVLGFVAMLALTLFDYRGFTRVYNIMYGFLLLLLAGVLFAAPKMGARRWFDLGFMDLQPSEAGKLIMIIAFSCLLLSRKENINKLTSLALAFFYMAIPFTLVFVEPDLGTSIVYVFFAFAIAWIAGVSHKLIIIILIIAALLVLGIFGLLYFLTEGYTIVVENENIPSWLPLEDYQIKRLVVFINPYIDPLKAGWNAIQVEVAVGSGGLWGKGYGEGTQVHNRFLPAPYTDFIFGVVGEELGFVGCAGVLLLYLLIILRGFYIAFHARDKLGAVMVAGIMSMFAGQIFINAGMCVSLVPITGITMPFLSYGGSNMLVNMACVGLVLSVSARSKIGFFQA